MQCVLCAVCGRGCGYGCGVRELNADGKINQPRQKMDSNFCSSYIAKLFLVVEHQTIFSTIFCQEEKSENQTLVFDLLFVHIFFRLILQRARHRASGSPVSRGRPRHDGRHLAAAALYGRERGAEARMAVVDESEQI